MGAMSTLTFANVVDDSILVYVEDQAAYARWLDEQTGGGVGEHKIDFARRQITYEPKLHKRNEVVAVAHVAGWVTHEPARLTWAWSDPNFADQPITKLVERVRGFGQARELSELTTPVLDLDPGHITQAVLRMAAVCCRITAFAVGQVVSSGGTDLVLLVDPAGFTPPRAGVATFAESVRGPIEQDLVHDHRRAVQGYVQARQLQYGWDQGFRTMRVGCPDGDMTVRFNDQGLLDSIEPG